MAKYWFCETPQWQRSSAPNESQRGTRQLQSRRCLGEAKGIDTVTGGRAETWTWASEHRGHSVMFSLKLSHRIFQCCVQAVVSEEITYHSPHTWQWGCISDPSSPFYTLESRFGLLCRKEVVGKPSCLSPLPWHHHGTWHHQSTSVALLLCGWLPTGALQFPDFTFWFECFYSSPVTV